MCCSTSTVTSRRRGRLGWSSIQSRRAALRIRGLRLDSRDSSVRPRSSVARPGHSTSRRARAAFPSNASAYSLNFTVVPPSTDPPANLTVWPAGTPSNAECLDVELQVIQEGHGTFQLRLPAHRNRVRNMTTCDCRGISVSLPAGTARNGVAPPARRRSESLGVRSGPRGRKARFYQLTRDS